MNAHHMMNSGSFGLSGLLLAQNHRSNVFSTLYDVWTCTWNYRNEMTGFSEKNSSGTVIASGTYTYDSLDRRIGVDETSGGTTTQTWIVYNGNSNTPYAQFNGSGTLLERYLAGPSYVLGVTGMVARTNASGVTDWYLTGKLGSVRDIVDTSGTVIDHISYGAFGSIRAETNPSAGSQFKFDGIQYDTITGLYNDWHRNYDSTIGQFITFDPTQFRSGEFDLYKFSLNSPVNFIDLNGYNIQISHYTPSAGSGGQFVIGVFLTDTNQQEFDRWKAQYQVMLEKTIAYYQAKYNNDKKDESLIQLNYYKQLKDNINHYKLLTYTHIHYNVIKGYYSEKQILACEYKGDFPLYSGVVGASPGPFHIEIPAKFNPGAYTVIMWPADESSVPGVVIFGPPAIINIVQGSPEDGSPPQKPK